MWARTECLECFWRDRGGKIRRSSGERGDHARGASLNAALCSRIEVVPRPPSDGFPLVAFVMVKVTDRNAGNSICYYRTFLETS